GCISAAPCGGGRQGCGAGRGSGTETVAVATGVEIVAPPPPPPAPAPPDATGVLTVALAVVDGALAPTVAEAGGAATDAPAVPARPHGRPGPDHARVTGGRGRGATGRGGRPRSGRMGGGGARARDAVGQSRLQADGYAAGQHGDAHQGGLQRDAARQPAAP